ncbi:MAG: NAD-dependent epimerase/dehydratase family protein [Bryobacteraceae bacterium]
MPDRIFLTGASGYIGGAVAATLRASGYEIVALARSGAAATGLESAGFTVLRGDLADTGGLAAAARSCDAVVHAAMQWGERAGALDDAAVTAMLDAIAGTDKTLLYTSGVWVFGSTGERKVRSMVISPAHVYGRGGGMGPRMVRQARETGVIRMVGDGSNHVSFVHIGDVADAAAHAGGGYVEPWPLEEARRKLGPIADALVLDQRIASTKAGRLLGWVARGRGVLEELDA